MDSSSCLAKVVSALAPMVPRPGPESVLAEDVRSALRRAGLIPEIEVTLIQGRVDLRVGATAIEVQSDPEAMRRLAEEYLRKRGLDPQKPPQLLMAGEEIGE